MTVDIGHIVVDELAARSAAPVLSILERCSVEAIVARLEMAPRSVPGEGGDAA